MGDYLGLIEMLLVFGIVLAWAIRELVLVRRAQRKDRDEGEGGGL